VPILFWDASALTKRYYAEVGSDTVDTLFAAVPVPRMVTTFWGYVETYASLLRRRNRGDISAGSFALAATLLQVQILNSPAWLLLTIEDSAVLGGIQWVQRHSLNTTDAAILTTWFRYTRSMPPNSPKSVLVAADQRLLRAADAEGLTTLNPEAVAASDVQILLSTL
jgi:hypothetical protein